MQKRQCTPEIQTSGLRRVHVGSAGRSPVCLRNSDTSAPSAAYSELNGLYAIIPGPLRALVTNELGRLEQMRHEAQNRLRKTAWRWYEPDSQKRCSGPSAGRLRRSDIALLLGPRLGFHPLHLVLANIEFSPCDFCHQPMTDDWSRKPFICWSCAREAAAEEQRQRIFDVLSSVMNVLFCTLFVFWCILYSAFGYLVDTPMHRTVSGLYVALECGLCGVRDRTGNLGPKVALCVLTTITVAAYGGYWMRSQEKWRNTEHTLPPMGVWSGVTFSIVRGLIYENWKDLVPVKIGRNCGTTRLHRRT